MTMSPYREVVVRNGGAFLQRSVPAVHALLVGLMLWASPAWAQGGATASPDDMQAIREAAEHGVAVAQYALGVMYASGQGVSRDEAMAAQWYRLAAEQGDTRAQHNLGLMYMNGRGVAKDDAEAVRWYRQAAEQGVAESQNNLAVMYATGRGVPRDDAEAMRWYR